jgi:phosphate uptake regulator
MKRKLIKHGFSSLSVTLPSTWVKQHNLRNTDEVDVQMQDQKLVVTANAFYHGEKHTIHFKEEHAPVIRTVLAAAHEYGFDELELTFDSPLIYDIIKYEQGLLLGFEIMEQSESRCLLRSISYGLPTEFDNVVKRLVQVTLALSRSAFEKLERGDLQRVDEIISLEETNNKLSDYCQRILNKTGYSKPKKASFVYVTCWQLEKIADDYRNMVLAVKDSCGDFVHLSEKTMKYISQTNILLERFLRLFTRFSMDSLAEFRSDTRRVMNSILRQKGSILRQDRIVQHYVISILTRTADLSNVCVASNFERII